MLQKVFFVLPFFILPLIGCSQSKHVHPPCENAAFDLMLENLLNFSVPLVSCEEVQRNRLKYTLLDARELEEYNVSHLPGAKFVGYEQFNLSVVQNLDKSKPIVVYCSVGYRSEKIAEKLIGAGFRNVKNLYGSIFEWTNKGYPLNDGSGKNVQKLHTYNQQWSKWVNRTSIQKVY